MRQKHRLGLSIESLTLEGDLFIPDTLEKIVQQRARYQETKDYGIHRGLNFQGEISRFFQIAKALYQDFLIREHHPSQRGRKAAQRFLNELLGEVLGFHEMVPGPAVLGERLYPVDAVASGRVPVVIADPDKSLDQGDSAFVVDGSGARKKAPGAMLAEYLSAQGEHLWGLVSNGHRMRLMRSSSSLGRPSYLEADLDKILGENRYPDFSGFWLLFHGSRGGSAGREPDSCPWERWRAEGLEEGMRVRDGLRDGVTQALIGLGRGFLRTPGPGNEALREALLEGCLSADEYYQELLRLVYRFLFLYSIEERRLLGEEGRMFTLYRNGYSMARFREMAMGRRPGGHHLDLWESVQVVFRALAVGEKRLGLPALGGIFRPDQCPHIDGAYLSNDLLLEAQRELRWTRTGQGITPVDYGNMGPEELGSIYESLLELVPRADPLAREFGFVGITDEGSSAGNARKTTGSYYTPDSLVQQLLDTALDPVIEERLEEGRDNPEEALLSISVIDPSCGSGHFLLSAGRRLAQRLAVMQSAEGSPTRQEYRHSLRQVVGRCLFGVDRNPMAVELARMALWIEGYEPGRPLSFLDHHIVCGDSLVGIMDFKTLEGGISGQAFKALTGDDKKVCAFLAAENRKGIKALVKEQEELGFGQLQLDRSDALDSFKKLEALSDDTPEEVAQKEKAYLAALEEARRGPLAGACDMAVGAFLLPKVPGAAVPTSIHLSRLLREEALQDAEVPALEAARWVCREARVFHWPLAFPQVFARGGFDVVLGNPPWDMLQLDPQEFFSVYDSEISDAQNMSKREALINKLEKRNPDLHRMYLLEKRKTEAVQSFVHEQKRFESSGTGRINLASLFTETSFLLINKKGRAGLVVPSGLATDSFTQDLFNKLNDGWLFSLYDFVNGNGIFPSVHKSYKFSLVTIGQSVETELGFFLSDVRELKEANRTFQLSTEEFQLINPNTKTCPVFRTRTDADLTKKIYRKVPVLWREATDDSAEVNPWGLKFQLMFMMNTASYLFLDAPASGSLPLYEAKMAHQFDHRWATYEAGGSTRDVTDAEKQNPCYEVRPRYWVPEKEVLTRIARVPRDLRRAYASGEEAALAEALASWLFAGRLKQLHPGEEDKALMKQDLSGEWKAFCGLHPWAAALALPEPQALARQLKEAEDFPVPALSAAPPQTDGELADLLMDAASPRWLMGWRDICRSTDERTVIASVIPRAGVGNKVPLLLFEKDIDAKLAAVLFGCLNSLVHDYCARQKVGGTTLNFYLIKQFPVLPPEAYSPHDLDFIVPRVLELTYTAQSLKPWARDLGYEGEPFPFDLDRRALLRAELDARYARLYGLDRQDLRYILDPKEVHGEEFPSESFRVLKYKEIRAWGEYRTGRLVMEAWDRQEGSSE